MQSYAVGIRTGNMSQSQHLKILMANLAFALLGYGYFIGISDDDEKRREALDAERLAA